ncbi:Protein of unknown function [Cotesia congregata]|uniref:Uncharacterized protein n=1 Tax=Cotesia congregata TaxID=51543 RepID=A0A8J2HNU0_COTCN|nr:Protein of unknown function [Cotesia congregata]
MTDGKAGSQTGNLNLKLGNRNLVLGRTASAGDLTEAILRGKRKEREAESEWRLEKDKIEREVVKRSKLLSKSPEKNKELTEGEMEAIMKKLSEIDVRIMEECAGLGRRVDQLKEEGKKEREELKKMWEEDRKQMSERIERLEGRLERLEKAAEEDVDMSADGDTTVRKRGQVDSGTERRMRKIEMDIEKREREIRRKNVILKGVDMRESVDWKTEVDRVWNKMEVVGGRKNMRKIGALDKEGKGLLLIELEGLEKKKEVMEAKNKLKGEKIRVEDDLTYEERRIKKIVMEEAFKERAAGKNVKVGYMKLLVCGNLRQWDEAEGRWKLEEGNE